MIRIAVTAAFDALAATLYPLSRVGRPKRSEGCTMTNMKNLGGATLMAAGVLALSPSAVSARIICNEWGQRWRVHGHYHPGWGWPVRPYPWRWQEEGDGYGGWGEHEGHGHWQWEED